MGSRVKCLKTKHEVISAHLWKDSPQEYDGCKLKFETSLSDKHI